jgi:hypothetical protein
MSARILILDFSTRKNMNGKRCITLFLWVKCVPLPYAFDVKYMLSILFFNSSPIFLMDVVM